MKLAEGKMNAVVIANLDIGVKMIVNGIADHDAFVKMKPAEGKMNAVVIANLDIEVK